MRDTAIPPHPDDLRSLRDLLHLAVSVYRSQTLVAKELGIDRTTVGKYLSGERTEGLGWHVVVAALRGAAREHPDQAPRIVQAMAERWLDLEGIWVPHGKPTGRSFEEELGDVVDATGETVRARRTGDSEAENRANARLVREVIELASVPRRAAS
jgi:hypothetical protein